MKLNLFCSALALAVAVPAFATAPRSRTVASTAAVASQLGDANARILWDGNGRVHRAYGQLCTLGHDPLAVESFLRDRAAPLGLRDDEQLPVVRDEVDAFGLRHVHVQRRLFGLEVKFDSIRIHARADGTVYAIESELSSLSGLQYRPPALLPIQAERIARRGFPGELNQPSRPHLVILGDVLPTVTGTHLAYEVRIAYPRSNGKLPVVEDGYVDAQTGVLLRTLSQVFSDGTPGTMTSPDLLGNNPTINITSYSGQGVALKDSTSLMNGGQIYTLDGSNQNNQYTTTDTNTPFSDPESVSVSENVSGAIEFFLNTFQWTHWDFNQSPSGLGGTLAGIAHVGQQLDNAYFTTASANGQTIGTMNFGDGDGQEFTPLAKATDVTGHELGHGIVAGSAALVYENQSGALNEHIADTFGWEFNNSAMGNPSPPIDTIGATVVGPALAPALRNLCDPHQGFMMGDPRWQPANMSEFQQLPDDDNDDHGGVHINSGIPNYAACQFRNAVTTAGGNGFQAVEQVWFQTLTMHLGPTSAFADMVSDTATSCMETNQGSATCAALANAWAAVGLATNVTGTTCPTNATSEGGTCVCNSGYAPSSDGSSCVTIDEPSCPMNAHDDSGQCYCDSGYVPDTMGNCVASDTSQQCPANASYQGGSCVCDECFNPVTNTPGDETDFTCQAIAGCMVCSDPTQAQPTDGGSCTCETGTTPSGGTMCPGLNSMESMEWDETMCCPVVGQCGTENFAGRCVGNVLVFCDDTQNPEEIATIDCSMNQSASICGFDQGEGGYDCVAPVSDCGMVPETGVCNGTLAQICEGGVLESVDCGSAGCGAVMDGSTTYNYCLSANGTMANTLPDGGVMASTTGGVGSGGSTGSTGAAAGSTGSSGSSSGGSGGCTTGEGASVLAFLALGLAMTRRRR